MATSGCSEIVYNISLPKLGFSKQLTLIKVLGDGSCFFHSLLRAFHKGYIQSRSNSERFQYVKLLRSAIASALGEIDKNGVREYDRLGGGYYAEFNKFVSGAVEDKTGHTIEIDQYSLENLQKELLSDRSVDHSYIQILSDDMNLDIYLVYSKTGDIYTTGTDLNLVYKNRNSIIIFYTPGHYDVIGIKRVVDKTIPGICNVGDIVFDCLFHPQHELIQCLKKRLAHLIK